MRRNRKAAFFTHSRVSRKGGHLYYFAPEGRARPPYKVQLEVRAILDIAADGTLAGVELIDPLMPPPPSTKRRAPRFEIFNDGPRRWVLVDNESDDPICFVYTSRAQAKAAIAHYR